MRLRAALRRETLDRPPIWFMRQAGRYLPEYREWRGRYTFEEAMRNPSIAAELTLQPIRRFPLDAAIVFADIMTPLEGMGVGIEFAPGPRLTPLSAADVARLPEFAEAKVDFVAETVARVRREADPAVAVIGFAGGPLTVLAYLLEGGGSQQWPRFRQSLYGETAREALSVLGAGLRQYLEMQIAAGADLVQVFDTWAGLLSVEQFVEVGLPEVRKMISGLGVPTVYFAPASAHLLDLLPTVGASALGCDWRLPLSAVWGRVGADSVLQGNLDPAVLLTDPETIRRETRLVLADADRPGHIFNLGHGVLPQTEVSAIEAMIEAVLRWSEQ